MRTVVPADNCRLTVTRPDATWTDYVEPAPCTFTVGDLWLTLLAGVTRVVAPQRGETVRVASEADILAWTPEGVCVD